MIVCYIVGKRQLFLKEDRKCYLLQTFTAKNCVTPSSGDNNSDLGLQKYSQDIAQDLLLLRK